MGYQWWTAFPDYVTSNYNMSALPTAASVRTTLLRRDVFA